MGRYDDRVQVARTFLTNRAQLRRFTTFRELRQILDEATGHSRRHSDRGSLANILRRVDDATLEEHGVMLSAMVVHLEDNHAGHRFFEQAQERGLTDERDDKFHTDMVAKVYAAYPEADVSVPDDVSELDEDQTATQA